jgi:hypothetical protein
MPGRQGTLNPMQNSGPLRAPSNGSGFTLVDMPSAPAAPAAQPALSTVGVSAAWRKLVLQANMAAPHLQVAAIEGESGSGKHTLARYIFSRSPMANSAFQRRDAREWLATDADPSALTGYIYLDRVDLLAPPGQGLLLGVLKTLQDRPPGRAVVIASSQVPLRHLAAQGQFLPDLAYRLTAIRFAVPPLRQRREDIPRSPSSCWKVFAGVTSSDPRFLVPAPWPAFCSTVGRATYASLPAFLKPRSLKSATGSFSRPIWSSSTTFSRPPKRSSAGKLTHAQPISRSMP